MDAFGTEWHGFAADDQPSFVAELSTTPGRTGARHNRKSDRKAVEVGAGLRQRGASGVSVQVKDLSSDGFKVATHLDLPAGTDVWLRLPGLEACHAKVMWSEGYYVGCAFERPLHPAVVDMVVRNAGSR